MRTDTALCIAMTSTTMPTICFSVYSWWLTRKIENKWCKNFRCMLLAFCFMATSQLMFMWMAEDYHTQLIKAQAMIHAQVEKP